MSEKTYGEKLTEDLLFKPENVYEKISDEEIEKANEFCESYKTFLNHAKTERESIDSIIQLAKEKGFNEYIYGTAYNSGDKFFYNNRGKSIILVKMGRKNIESGLKIVMAHVDSPRLDFKPRPLYEESELAFLRTNYYGGIKKYQWPTLPLAIHGIIYKANGDCVKINIGEDENDPVFCVTDLLPHLDREQGTKPIGKAIEGENLTVLVGSRPFKDDKASEKVKLNIIKILNEKYGICEKDFMSAELEAVPAFKAILQDDDCEKTSVCLLCDKEETGSDGNTGLSSNFFNFFMDNLCKSLNANKTIVFKNSLCLSADVTAAYDPVFPTVHDKNNAAFLNRGVSVMKYSGSGGKYSTSDASAETMSYFRRIFDENNVAWQIGCLGKVDGGGGGTLAKYIALLDIDTLDIGVPIISMHAPFEIASKIDIYMAFKAFKVFLTKELE
ncbi:MAG: aminopeptidase [Oscillospiraceae bacterium]